MNIIQQHGLLFTSTIFIDIKSPTKQISFPEEMPLNKRNITKKEKKNHLSTALLASPHFTLQYNSFTRKQECIHNKILKTVHPIKYAQLYFALFCCGYFISNHWNHVIKLPISFRVASMALGQSYDCPSASEVTLKDMGKIDQHQNTAMHEPCGHSRGVLYILMMYL